MTSLTVKSMRVRLANHYVARLRLAAELYQKGQESSAEGLLIFDREWSHVQYWQEWAARYVERDPDAADLCIELTELSAEFLTLRLPLPDQIAWLNTALSIAQSQQRPRAELDFLNRLADLHCRAGDTALAAEIGARALALAEQAGDRRSMALNGNLRGEIRRCLGDLPGARALFADSLALAEAAHRPLDIAHGHRGLGRVAWDGGDWAEAFTHFDRQLALAMELGRDTEICDALRNLGQVRLAQGDPEGALALLNRCVETCERIGDRQTLASALDALGGALVELGRLDEAQVRFLAALSTAQSSGCAPAAAAAHMSLGGVLTLMGRDAEAAGHLDQAIAQGRQLGRRGMLGAALTYQARACWAGGQLDRAEECLREAAALAVELDNRVLKMRAIGEAACLLALSGQHALAAEWASSLLGRPDMAYPDRACLTALCARMGIAVSPTAAADLDPLVGQIAAGLERYLPATARLATPAERSALFPLN